MSEQNIAADPHQGQEVLTAGKSFATAQGAMILIHGRGASAYDIMELGLLLGSDELALLAPQAANYTWYPYSFLAPIADNEPYLSSALAAVAGLVERVETAGIPTEKIILAGFSQGACLASEFAARNARRYGGLLLFSGGLIGPPGTPRDYAGSFSGTPVFIGCSDIDAHIPLVRVQETTETLTALGADVNEKIYPGMGHTIIQDEMEQAKKIVDQMLQESG
ncbi:MAG: alpha/beta hydrolase [Candidatus Promineifilaceae bacterium]|jgi:predicted esterase